jgi:hypothetical protein
VICPTGVKRCVGEGARAASSDRKPEHSCKRGQMRKSKDDGLQDLSEVKVWQG